MAQKKFIIDNQKVDEDIIRKFHACITNILSDLQANLSSRTILTEIINGRPITREDTASRSAPEDFTEQKVILPLLSFLGYHDIKRRTGSNSKFIRGESDFTVTSGNIKILIESEPLNKDLDVRGVGINQLSGYLEIRSFNSSHGIATNGFRWVLLKYDDEKHNILKLVDIDIRTLFFYHAFGQTQLDCSNDLINNFYLSFSVDHIRKTTEDTFIELRDIKEKISKNFYEDYIKYVFGHDKNGKSVYCLLDGIKAPNSSTESDRRLFAVTLINRLIFIKYLEDKKLVNDELLKILLKQFRRSPLPTTFYKTYLEPLFFDVFNTEFDRRKRNIRMIEEFSNIPYLNGGLFREVVPNERSYDVDNDILSNIIEHLFERYDFMLSGPASSLDPNVLGNVFERTINYLTGPGTDNQRKAKGAYYTPENITSFIAKTTIRNCIMDKIKRYLLSVGWPQHEVDIYNDLNDFLDQLPKNPKTLIEINNIVDGIKILDPACGSGHFLSSALNEMVFIKSRILSELSIGESLYEIKKQIISKNLYGVDIEGSAVEIAKLRLWLNLIEQLDLGDAEEIETLPNIDYNILSGNSLVGWSVENYKQRMISNPYDERIDGIFSGLIMAYSDKDNDLMMVRKSKELLSGEGSGDIADYITAYSLLRKLYSQEEGLRALQLREILQTIKKSIYNVLTPALKFYALSDDKRRTEKISKYKLTNPFHWSVDFGNIIESGGFDVIIGNPPYGISFDPDDRKFIETSLNLTKSFFSSEMAFIEKSTLLCKNKGYLGLIIPKALAYSQKWKIGRDLVVKDLIEAVDVSKAFDDVKLEQMIIIMKVGEGTPNYLIRKLEDGSYCSIAKETTNKADAIIFYSNEIGQQIFSRVLEGTSLGKVSRTSRGLPLQSLAVKERIGEKIYSGKHVQKFSLLDTDNYLNIDIMKSSRKKILFLNQPKIMTQRILAHVKNPFPQLSIAAVVDYQGVFNFDTVENTVPKDSEMLEYIACLLNSTFISWYAYHFIFSDAIRGMDFDEYYMNKIPLPIKYADLVWFKEMYLSIVECIESINKKQEKTSIDDKMRIRLNILINQLNEKVYEIYGLNEEEIEIIESGL